MVRERKQKKKKKGWETVHLQNNASAKGHDSDDSGASLDRPLSSCGQHATGTRVEGVKRVVERDLRVEEAKGVVVGGKEKKAVVDGKRVAVAADEAPVDAQLSG